MAKKPKPPKLSDEQRFDWLRLIRSENVGPRTFRALINNCGGARAALEALPELARRGGASRPIRVAAPEDVERELAAARKLGVRFVALGEPGYPPVLRHIDSAPPVLAVAGREEALQQPAVAIVGSRNASAAGLTFADRLARGLGRAGYIVVSGLARGIDQRVHAASLETGALGVLAGGHAKPYPSEAVPLIARMVEFGAVGTCPDATVSSPGSHWGRSSSRRPAARGRSSPQNSPSSKTVRCSRCPARPSILAPRGRTTSSSRAQRSARTWTMCSPRSNRRSRATSSPLWRRAAKRSGYGANSRFFSSILKRRLTPVRARHSMTQSASVGPPARKAARGTGSSGCLVLPRSRLVN